MDNSTSNTKPQEVVVEKSHAFTEKQYESEFIDSFCINDEVKALARKRFVLDYNGETGIGIPYLTMEGHKMTFRKLKETDKKSIDAIAMHSTHEVFNMRYRRKENKYVMMAGKVSGYKESFPYLGGLLDFNVIDDCNPLEEIYFVEGEKKAYAMCSIGMNTVGITGVNNFAQKSEKKVMGRNVDCRFSPAFIEAMNYIGAKGYRRPSALNIVLDADVLSRDPRNATSFVTAVCDFATCASSYGADSCKLIIIDPRKTGDINRGLREYWKDKGADDLIINHKEVRDETSFLEYCIIVDLFSSRSEKIVRDLLIGGSEDNVVLSHVYSEGIYRNSNNNTLYMSHPVL